MSLIRYQSPEVMAWPSLDQWSGLRDDLNSLFELPFWSSFVRRGELFSGWSLALDLYQNNDNAVAVIELPGMRKEDIEISLHAEHWQSAVSERGKLQTVRKRNAPNATSGNSAGASRSRPG